MFHRKALHSVQYQIICQCLQDSSWVSSSQLCMNMLPSINSDFQKGEQQCAAQFFQEFCRELGYKTSE